MNKQFTKADLKVGYLVGLRNGNMRMIMPKASGADTVLVVTDAKGFWSWLSDYRDDLTFDGVKAGAPTDHDIMKVYGLATLGAYTMDFDGYRRDLLWEREEKPKQTCEKCVKRDVCFNRLVFDNAKFGENCNKYLGEALYDNVEPIQLK